MRPPPPPTALPPGHPALRTKLCELFGVDYPIVATGMGWVSTPELTAAAANAGALGVLAAGPLTLTETDAAIGRTTELCGRPIGVNLATHSPDLPQRARLLARHDVKVASFGLTPPEQVIRDLKQHGLIVVVTVGACRQAEKVAAWGADAVIAQGCEGGGQAGNVPTSILLPQVTAAVGIPVIGAGGFADGRGLVAALAYGAAGIAMGTRFLLTADSPVPEGVKAEYLKATVADTIVTDVLDGVPQRVLATLLARRLTSDGPVSRLARSARHARTFRRMSGLSWREVLAEGLALRRSRELSWHQVLTAANTPMMLRASMVGGRTDLGTLASGQVAGVINDLPGCAELVSRIIAEATDVLDGLTRAAGNR